MVIWNQSSAGPGTGINVWDSDKQRGSDLAAAVWFKHTITVGQTSLHVSFNPVKTPNPEDVEVKLGGH